MWSLCHQAYVYERSITWPRIQNNIGGLIWTLIDEHSSADSRQRTMMERHITEQPYALTKMTHRYLLELHQCSQALLRRSDIIWRRFRTIHHSPMNMDRWKLVKWLESMWPLWRGAECRLDLFKLLLWSLGYLKASCVEPSCVWSLNLRKTWEIKERLPLALGLKVRLSMWWSMLDYSILKENAFLLLYYVGFYFIGLFQGWE